MLCTVTWLYVALIHYVYNYSASTLCTEGSVFQTYYFYFVLVSFTLFRLTEVANHTLAWTHMWKNGGYHYLVISISIPVSEYWHKYPMLKLSSISCSSALILAHIIKNIFNSAYYPCLIVTGTSDWQLQHMCRNT